MAQTTVNTSSDSSNSENTTNTNNGGMFGDINSDSFMSFVKNPLGMALAIGIVLTITIYFIV